MGFTWRRRIVEYREGKGEIETECSVVYLLVRTKKLCFFFFWFKVKALFVWVLHLMAVVVVSVHRPYATHLISENPNPPKIHLKFSTSRLSFHHLSHTNKHQLRCLSAKSTPSSPDPESPKGLSFPISVIKFLSLIMRWVFATNLVGFRWGRAGECGSQSSFSNAEILQE